MCVVYFHMIARNSATRRSYREPHTCPDYCRVGVYNGAAIRLQIGVLALLRIERTIVHMLTIMWTIVIMLTESLQFTP